MVAIGFIVTDAPHTDVIQSYVRALQADVVKVVTAWGVTRGWTEQARRTVADMANTIIVRTAAGDPSYASGAYTLPESWLVIDEIRPWYAARNPNKRFVIEIGNEPLITPQPEPFAWQYRAHLQVTIAELRAQFPKAIIVAPAHMLNHPVALGTYAYGQRQMLAICADAYRQCDGVAIHAYTHQQLDEGIALVRELVGQDMPIWLTECALNEALAPAERGKRYAQLIAGRPLEAATFYHLAATVGSDPIHYNPNYTLSPAILAAVRTHLEAPMPIDTLNGLVDSALSEQIQREIAALPRKPGAQKPAQRQAEQSITFHFSDVVYANRDRASELKAIVAEAKHHLAKNWQSDPQRPPIYGSRYMYDFVVLSDGAVIALQPDRPILWHAGNVIANTTSWSVHVLLGKGQDLTVAQKVSVIRLFVALAQRGKFPPGNVYGHCEWPRDTGAAKPSAIYTVQPGQSACPERVLHTHLVQYRAKTDAESLWVLWGTTVPLAPEQRGWSIPQAWLNEGGRWGQALTPEYYPPNSPYSVSMQVFERGVAIYNGTTKAVRFAAW